jgi:hypothetical protein
MLLLNRPSRGAVGIKEHAAVLEDTRKERAASAHHGCDDLRRRKGLCMLLQPFQAEELGADRLFRIRKDDVRQLSTFHSRASKFRGEKLLPNLAACPYKCKGHSTTARLALTALRG